MRSIDTAGSSLLRFGKRPDMNKSPAILLYNNEFWETTGSSIERNCVHISNFIPQHTAVQCKRESWEVTAADETTKPLFHLGNKHQIIHRFPQRAVENARRKGFAVASIKHFF